MPRLNRKNSNKSLTETDTGSATDSDNEQSNTSSIRMSPSSRRGAQHSQQPRSILGVRTLPESLAQSYTPRATDAPLVCFGQVEIREYPRRPGVNPGCRMGVSLTLEWNHQDEVSVELDQYEETRPERRERLQMLLPAEVRMQLMRDAGYARGEILQYVKVTNVARGQRARTNETLQLASAQEMAQRLFRGVLNKSVRRKSKQMEKQTLSAQIQQDQEMLALRRKFDDEAPSEGRLRRANSNKNLMAKSDSCNSLGGSNNNTEAFEMHPQETLFLCSSAVNPPTALSAVFEVEA